MHGEMLGDYFVDRAYFSDLFSPMIKPVSQTYTDPYYSNYPPFANLIYCGLRLFVPNASLEDKSYLSTMGGSIVLLMYIIVAVLALVFAVYQSADSLSSPMHRWLVSMVIALSGPVLFMLSRGNNVAFVVPLLFGFAFLRNHDNAIYRELSIVCLAIATAIKIYPMLFALILIFERNRKLFLRFLLYTVLIYAVSFIPYGGMSAVQDFIANLFLRDGSYSLNHVISFEGMLRLFAAALFSGDIDVNSLVLKILVLAFCSSFFVLSNQEWKHLFAICLMIIWIPNGSYLYNICILLIPIVAFINDSKQTPIDICCSLLFGFLLCPFFFPKISFFPSLPLSTVPDVSWSMVVINVIMLFLAGLLLIDCIIEYTTRKLFAVQKQQERVGLLRAHVWTLRQRREVWAQRGCEQGRQHDRLQGRDRGAGEPP